MVLRKEAAARIQRRRRIKNKGDVGSGGDGDRDRGGDGVMVGVAQLSTWSTKHQTDRAEIKQKFDCNILAFML